jgi:pimeloyl-ACP methyl ester carboxylesterase
MDGAASLSAGAAIPEVEVHLNAGGHALRAHAWDGGNARRVLLLHGLGGNSITWHGVAPLLARGLSAKVIAPDLPGFGATRPGPGRLSVQVLADITQQIVLGSGALAELVGPPSPWIVAGNSLGGLIALELCRTVPESIASVTLAAGALPLLWGRTGGQMAGLLRFTPGLLPGLGQLLVQRYFERTGLPGVVDEPVRELFGDPSALRAELRERLLAVSEYRMGWTKDAARAYAQVTRSIALELMWPGRTRRAIASVRCPVQVIYGSHDPLFPAAAWRKLELLRPDWDYVCLPGVGHVPQLEAPDAFAAHMLSWLGRHVSSGRA